MMLRHLLYVISRVCRALVFFVLFVMADKPELSDTIIYNEGLWERLNLVFMYLPLLTVSIRQIIRG